MDLICISILTLFITIYFLKKSNKGKNREIPSRINFSMMFLNVVQIS